MHTASVWEHTARTLKASNLTRGGKHAKASHSEADRPQTVSTLGTVVCSTKEWTGLLYPSGWLIRHELRIFAT